MKFNLIDTIGLIYVTDEISVNDLYNMTDMITVIASFEIFNFKNVINTINVIDLTNPNTVVHEKNETQKKKTLFNQIRISTFI